MANGGKPAATGLQPPDRGANRMSSIAQHTGVVYMITCIKTGDRYLGGTIDFDRRIGEHERGKTRADILASITEHGWENHVVVKVMQGIHPDKVKRCEAAFNFIIRPEMNKMMSDEDGNYHHAESTRRQIGDAQRGERSHLYGKPSWISGKKQSPEYVEKRAAANRGQKRTPEQCARMSKAHLESDYVPSSATREKQSAALRGRKQSPEHLANRVEGRREYFRTVRKHRALNELRAIGWPMQRVA